MRNENGAFKNTNEDRPFLKPQKPLLSGWVDGDQKGPSNSLNFKYYNTEDTDFKYGLEKYLRRLD